MPLSVESSGFTIKFSEILIPKCNQKVYYPNRAKNTALFRGEIVMVIEKVSLNIKEVMFEVDNTDEFTK